MCWQGSEVGTVLVVCPPTLVRNWARELTRWGPFAVEAPVAADQGLLTWKRSNQESWWIAIQILMFTV